MKKKITTFMALMVSLLISARCFAQDSLVPFDARSAIWGGMFAPQSPEAMAITRYGTITEAVWQHGNITYDPICCLTFSYILLGQPYAVSDSSAKEIQTTAGVNLIDFGARLYDDRICRWTSQDPLAAKYPAFSPYAYCAGDPVNLVDPTGMEGVKYIDNNGQKTIESNIVVLVQAPSKISEHASDKQRRRIQNNNKDILANNSRRINSVINTLNRVYNGDAGGSYNSSGDLVHFKFNVIPVETNDLENGNDQSLMQTALDNGLPSSQYGNDTISKAAIITTRSTEGNLGLFSGVSISVQPESFEFALPHEVGHSLGLGDTYWPDPKGKDQKPGGLMDNPPASPNASEVDKIWTKARNKRQ